MEEKKPHDKYFKASFSNLRVVLEFMENFFPKELLEELNLKTLQLEDVSFIDPGLKTSFSDLIYSCALKSNEKIRITLLWEHKSYIPRYPHVQLLKYLINHWEADIINKRPLTIILPIVFYHGKTQWKYRPFNTFFKNLLPAFKIFIPHFEYVLADLSQYSDEEILNLDAQTMIPSLMLMKHAREEKYIEKNIPKIFYKFVKSYLKDSEGLKKLFDNALNYIYQTTELKPQTVKNQTDKLSEELGEIIMSTAKRLHSQGKNEGILIGLKQGESKGEIKGRLEEKKILVKNGFKMGLDIETLSKITNLSIDEVQKIIIEENK